MREKDLKNQRSPLERRGTSNRRSKQEPPPDNKERRIRDRRTAIADRRIENNIQLVTFYLGGEFFGIPVNRVQEIVRPQVMTPVPNSDPSIRGLINLRGQIVTAIDLKKVFGMNEKSNGHESMNVIINFADGADSLLVDEIGDVLEVAATKIEPPPSSMRGIDRKYVSGVCKLEKSLLVILDVERVTKRVEV